MPAVDEVRERSVADVLAVDPFASSIHVAREIGLTESQVRKTQAWRSRRDPMQAPHYEFDPPPPGLVTPQAQPSRVDPWAWLDWAAKGSTLHAEAAPRQKVIEWAAPFGGPIAMAFLGDAHIMATNCDHARVKADLELIRDCPNLYVGLLGDQCEHMISGFKDAAAVAQQMAGPEMQCRIWWALLRELRTKIAFCSLGNHEAFAEKMAGVDLFGLGVEGVVPLFAGKGLVRVKVGLAEYTVLTQHKGSGRSQYDATAPAKRAYAQDYPADVVVSAHTHRWGISWDEAYPLGRDAGFGGDRVCCNVGTYQTGQSAYGDRLGGAGARYAVPTVVLYPERKKIVAFREIGDAITYLRGINHGS